MRSCADQERVCQRVVRACRGPAELKGKPLMPSLYDRYDLTAGCTRSQLQNHVHSSCSSDSVFSPCITKQSLLHKSALRTRAFLPGSPSLLQQPSRRCQGRRSVRSGPRPRHHSRDPDACPGIPNNSPRYPPGSPGLALHARPRRIQVPAVVPSAD